MTTQLLPVAEHVLVLALARAEGMIREGRMDDAIRCLNVAVAAADLIQDMEAEQLVSDADLADWEDELMTGDQP